MRKLASVFLLLVSFAVGFAKDSLHVYVFLKDTCPHTAAALPALRQLSTDLKGKGALMAFITVPTKDVEATQKKLKTNFTLMADPDATRSRQLGGKHSLDVLIVQGKDRVKFEGFGPKVLAELTKRTGVKFTSKVYPAKRMSGCGL
ncbi:MAG: redoxin domain-containing protein [Chthonomonas sp.]|nr:redoxin domain-containing protein [Chthonomonas sp.]